MEEESMAVDEEMEEPSPDRVADGERDGDGEGEGSAPRPYAVRPPRAAPSDTQAASWRTRRHAGGAREMQFEHGDMQFVIRVRQNGAEDPAAAAAEAMRRTRRAAAGRRRRRRVRCRRSRTRRPLRSRRRRRRRRR